MMLSSRTTLALAVLTAVAYHGSHEKPVGTAALEARYGLPRRALEPVLQQLGRNAFIRSVRGAQGGYYVESPDRMRIREVVEALEPEGLPRQPVTLVQPVLAAAFQPAHLSLLQALESITLAELVARMEGQGIARALEPTLDFTI